MAVHIEMPNAGDTASERAYDARVILIEAALLGILADLALRHAGEGLGWTVWVAALAFGALNVARRRGLVVTSEQLAWLGIAIACAAAFAWRDADDLRLANIFGTLVAVSMFAMSASGLPATSIFTARMRDVIAAGVFTIRDIVAGTPMLVAHDAELRTMPALHDGSSWTVARTVLLAAPVVLVFTLLLSRADPVFATIFALPNVDMPTIVSHVVIAGAFAWWSAGWIRGALLRAGRVELPQHLPARLGLAEITTTLGAVSVLFAIFVGLQLRWLFGGASVVLATTGLTVAEYARRGFFELVAAVALVLPLILGTGAMIEDANVAKRHRQLSFVLMVLVAGIIASAMLRMALYVGYFGLSTDRLNATAVMIWLAVVSGGMVLTVLRGRSRPFAAIAMLSGFATLGTLNVMNPELLVARVNLERGPGARGVDYAYLARLSGDATPAVVTALNGAAPSAASCEAAKYLRLRWLRDEDAAWNLGERHGRDAVVRQLPPTAVLRLCAGGAQSR